MKKVKVRRIVKHIKHKASGANSKNQKIAALKKELNKIPNDLSQFPLDQQQKYTQQIVKLAKQINTLRGHNVDNPTLYQDKVAYVMTYGIYDTLKTKCADKLGVKEYAKEILGYDICVPTLKVFDDIDNIDFSELPNQYVLKSNQGSGQVIVVKDNLHEVLNNKKKQQQIKNTMKNWLKLNYGKSAVETHYWNIKPKVFAEQYIENISSDSLGIKDYKFFVFNKKVRYIYVTKDYHVNGVRPSFNYYDENFNFIEDMAWPYPHSNDPSRIDEKPKFFEQMKDVAEKLANYFNLVRIDFYLTNDRFYLGEMTFTPSAGSFYFTKPEYNVKLGNMIQIFKV